VHATPAREKIGSRMIHLVVLSNSWAHVSDISYSNYTGNCTKLVTPGR
jgi:hypothetical protein